MVVQDFYHSHALAMPVEKMEDLKGWWVGAATSRARKVEE